MTLRVPPPGWRKCQRERRGSRRGRWRLEVRDPRDPANLDEYDVTGGELDGEPSPVRLSADEDLDASTFPVDEVAFDRIEAMADEALVRFGAEGAWVDAVDVRRTRGEGLRIVMNLNAPRASATATFTPDGELIEVVRR